MTTLTSILGSDLISASRAVINTNLGNLNSGKVESPITASVLGTGTASSTTFLRGDLTWQSNAVALTLIPQPPMPVTDTVNRTVTVDDTMYLGLVCVPFAITVNKITIRTGSATTPAPFKLSVYSEDGQTRLISVTTAILNSSLLYSTAVSSILLPAGNYWFAYNAANASVSVNMQTWLYGDTTAFGTDDGILYDVASEPKLQGSLAIVASTPPTTINPLLLTEIGAAVTPVFRLDT